ncbi:hypothetical protein JOQ06_026357, partial [Pogonophryne albipinna]
MDEVLDKFGLRGGCCVIDPDPAERKPGRSLRSSMTLGSDKQLLSDSALRASVYRTTE